jgi:Uma2 family endonuclease
MLTMEEPIFESVTSMDADQFEQWVLERNEWDVHHYELLHGRIVVTPPAGFPHGRVEAKLVARLVGAAEAAGAQTFGSSQGYVFPSGDVLEPDISVFSAERWREVVPIEDKFLRAVPDLVVEVLSKSTAHRDRGEKKIAYARNGVREYWLVDSRARTITVHRSDGARFDEGRVLADRDALDSVVLPGFACAVGELF